MKCAYMNYMHVFNIGMWIWDLGCSSKADVWRG